MDRLSCILVLGLLALSAAVQNKPSESPELPVGSLLRVAFSQPIEAENSKVGDPVRLTVLGLVVGKDTKRPKQPLTLLGHVTEVRVRADGQRESRIGIAFDKILIESLAEKRELTVSAVVNRVMTVEQQVHDTGARVFVPDDPVQRAAGPMVDSSGRSVPQQIQHSAPAPSSMQGIYEWPAKDLSLRPDSSTNTTVIICTKRNIVLGAETRMLVRVTGSGK